MAVTRRSLNCQKLTLAILHRIILFTFIVALENHSVQKSLQRGRGSISRYFVCYVCYYLHYGFKISMLLKYNLLLVATLITCQLNILFVCFCFKQINVFVIIETL